MIQLKTKEIERNHMDVDGRCTEMLEQFLKEPYPTWADVVHALRDGNHNNLADQILKDLLGPVVTSQIAYVQEFS